MSAVSNASTPSQAKPILILLAGRTYPEISQELGDYDDWIAAGLGDTVPHVRLDARDALSLPNPSEFSGVVVSGSHAMVTDREPWSERLAGWLNSCVETNTPVLAICYGHQLLAHAFGGIVDYRTGGLEFGTMSIELMDRSEDDPLFKDMPQVFPAQLAHSQSVIQLPVGARAIARSEQEPHQAFCLGRYAWGVQFHPEFSIGAMKAYIGQDKESFISQGINPEEVAANIGATPEAFSLLERFATFADNLSKR